MARIVPEGWQALSGASPAPALARELETLGRLARDLPDGYTVYHGVHWSRVEPDAPGPSLFGDIDFAIVSPAGHVLLLEQRTGFVQEGPDGLTLPQGREETTLAHRVGRATGVVRAKLQSVIHGGALTVEGMLFLPDYTVRQAETAGLDPARIVDAKRRGELVALIRGLLPDDLPRHPAAESVHRLLADELRLVPDIGAVADTARALYTRLAGGLAEWARRFEMHPHRLRVIGCAGSGKTQLALALYGDALNSGRRPLYVCFNRPLADHFASLVPVGGEVASYHQLCNRALRSTGLVPDFRQADAFARVESAFASMAIGDDWLFDELIVDEGQDFSADWRDAILRLLRPEGRGWWMEDPMQNLYGRELVALPGWAVLRSETNYRSPRKIVSFLNSLIAGQPAQETGSPVVGPTVDIETYRDSGQLIERTRRAVTQAIGLGFKRAQIAIVSFHGRDRSVLFSQEKLGPIQLRRFTGSYDPAGNPVFTEGDVLLETVYRFKGQSAPCVILAEVDFASADELALRKLLVGVTRATLKLILVVSEGTAAHLSRRSGP